MKNALQIENAYILLLYHILFPYAMYNFTSNRFFFQRFLIHPLYRSKKICYTYLILRFDGAANRIYFHVKGGGSSEIFFP